MQGRSNLAQRGILQKNEVYHERGVEGECIVSACFMTDLDGTLLNSRARLSDCTVTVLRQALASGRIVSFATARSMVSAGPLVSRVPWRFPVILFNGALLMDPATNRVLRGHYLEGDIVRDALALADGHGIRPFVYQMHEDGGESVLYEHLDNEGQRAYWQSRAGDPRFHAVRDLMGGLSGRAIELSFVAQRHVLEPLHRALQASCGAGVQFHFARDTYIPEYYFLEISHARANKRDGLLSFASLAGCDPADITVFGDNLNDMGMFAAAGRRVAVGNACPEIRARADEIAASNDEDGVAHYIARTLGLAHALFG